MGFEYYILLITFAFEASIYLRIFWKSIALRTLLAVSALTTGSFIASYILFTYSNPLVWVIALISVYRCINLLRLVGARMHDKYLYKATSRTSLTLFVSVLMSTVLFYAGSQMSLSTQTTVTTSAVTVAVVAVFLANNSLRSIRKTRTTSTVSQLATSELPSLTVAIPARNETKDLEECLDSVLHSNYPKLEVLVLDDCSQLRRTPEIIKGYAHKGVRFVKGEVVAENWLAKNQAYNKLLNEANGEIVVFCGVDIRMDNDSLYQMVNIMQSRQKRMVSVLPIRTVGERLRYAPIQSLRYMWELAPPRRLFNRPPVLSSVWAIYRSDAKKLGGFKAVSRTILPERYFAKRMLDGDSYSFLRASEGLSLYSVKSSPAQRSTAIRVRYPQLKRRPEAVLALSVLMIALFIAPYVVLVYAIYSVSPLLMTISSVAVISAIFSYSVISIYTKTMSWYIAPLMHLPAVLLDIALMHYSMYKYEFSEVIWKDRNVCVPVMHVVPKLPELPEKAFS